MVKAKRILNMNMKNLKKSNKYPESGDLFFYKIKSMEEKFFFGRVIRTDASIGGFEDTILIYLYKATSADKSLIPVFQPAELLVPPIATNALPWKKGFFETLTNHPINDIDVLKQHCFKDFRGRFFDADANPLSVPVEPVGDYGLHSYKTIDDAVSVALGLATAD